MKKKLQSLVNIDLEVKSKKWLEFKNIEKFCRKTCEELILLSEINEFLKKEKPVEVAISLVSSAQIKKINHKFRNKNKPTDVLSFSFLDEKVIRKKGFENATKLMPALFLGDIVLAFEVIKKEAALTKKDFHHHLTHLILHALLHLIGYDHEKKTDAKIMQSLEILILEQLKIRNPYS